MNKFLKRSKKKRKRKNKLRTITKVKKGGFMCRHNRNICFGKNIIFYKETVKELIKMYNLLLKNNFIVFLCDGTLLGYAREQDLLKNDDDICLGILDNNICYSKLEQLFTVNNYSKKIFDSNKILNNKNILRMRQYTFSKKFLEYIIEFDILIFNIDRIRNRMVCTNYFSKIEFFDYDNFKLKKVYFLNNYFYIPANYEYFLKSLYGDWKLEKPLFKWTDYKNINLNPDIYIKNLSCFSNSDILDIIIT